MWIYRSLGTSVIVALMAAERTGPRAPSHTFDPEEIVLTAQHPVDDDAAAANLPCRITDYAREPQWPVFTKRLLRSC
jgi:hypothetical protein